MVSQQLWLLPIPALQQHCPIARTLQHGTFADGMLCSIMASYWAWGWRRMSKLCARHFHNLLSSYLVHHNRRCAAVIRLLRRCRLPLLLLGSLHEHAWCQDRSAGCIQRPVHIHRVCSCMQLLSRRHVTQFLLTPITSASRARMAASMSIMSSSWQASCATGVVLPATEACVSCVTAHLGTTVHITRTACSSCGGRQVCMHAARAYMAGAQGDTSADFYADC